LNGCASLNRQAGYDEQNFYALGVDTATYHTVQRGETLYEIAKLYGRHYQEIARQNHISAPYIIYPGQRLLISGAASDNYTISAMSVPISVPTPIESHPLKAAYSKTTQTKKTPPRYHPVQRGETLYRIAKRYGQDFRQIAAWNHIPPPYLLKVGQKLSLTPTSSTLKAQSTVQNTTYHPVQPGDTLYSIAKRYGYNSTDLMNWNDLSSTELQVGKKLLINPPTKKLWQPTRLKQATYHQVIAGDTLYHISQRYRVNIDDLKKWNHLSSDHLSIGDRLRLSPTTKTLLSRASSTRSVQCHRVMPGETVYRLSKRYGHSMTDIATWNHLQWPYTLTVGQRLKVSPLTTACL
jgi:LysM repeat protein